MTMVTTKDQGEDDGADHNASQPTNDVTSSEDELMTSRPLAHEGVPLMRHHHQAHSSSANHDEANQDYKMTPNAIKEETSSSSASSKIWAPLYRHISMQRYDSTYSDDDNNAGSSTAAFSSSSDWNKTWIFRWRTKRGWYRNVRLIGLVIATIAMACLLLYALRSWHRRRSSIYWKIRTIEQAQKHYLDIGNGLTIWFRVWGNRESGIPVLFVHGGPGNAIADYENSNSHFFHYKEFYVVEVDQRGTGNSQPSVRESCHNMKYYTDITIEKMSHDFERVRIFLGIERWLVFGGSWGSTLSLDYAERYPNQVLGLIIRGIYLNTKEEFDAVYTRNAHLNYPKRLHEFDTWFARAQDEAKRLGEPPLDPNDGERFFRVYREMLLRCDKYAIWHWFVFENNLMETIPENLRDPNHIDHEQYPEALSVSFFENFLFYHGTFEDPPNLLERLHHLKSINVWVCQGRYDEVCPPQYAHELVDGLHTAGVSVQAHFVDSGHEASDPVMGRCLQQRVSEFLDSLDGST